MATFSHEIEFDVTCEACGNSLSVEEKEYRGNYELRISPCEVCMEIKQKEFDEIEANLQEEYSNLENYVEELRDEISALETQLIYTKIKNKEECTSQIST